MPKFPSVIAYLCGSVKGLEKKKRRSTPWDESKNLNRVIRRRESNRPVICPGSRESRIATTGSLALTLGCLAAKEEPEAVGVGLDAAPGVALALGAPLMWWRVDYSVDKRNIGTPGRSSQGRVRLCEYQVSG